MSKNKTIRFAFGTQENPESAIWRVIITKKKGDIYIHNVPEIGMRVHIALHASGKFHVKLGDKYHELSGPWKDGYGLIWGPVIFFYNWDREVKPLKSTGKINQINWLGLPEKDHFFIVKPTYGPVGVKVEPHSDEIKIAGPVRAKVSKEEMDFHLFVQHRPMSEPEKRTCSKSPSEPLKFKGDIPDRGEMIRVAKNTDLGPSAIILERFKFQKEI